MTYNFDGQLVYNVKNPPFSAYGDGIQVSDGVMAYNSTTLTCSTSHPFKATDVGKSITVVNAGGSNINYDGIYSDGTFPQLATTIAAYISSSQVTLAAPCNHLGGVSAVSVLFGHDDTTVIQNAFTQVGVTGGTVYLPAGMFCISSNLGINNGTGFTICGAGSDSTTIADLRAHVITPDPIGGSGLWFGIVSFYNCAFAVLRDIAVQGAFPIGQFPSTSVIVDGYYCINTHNSARKTVFMSTNTPNTGCQENFCLRVLSTQSECESIYGAGYLDGWNVEGCRVINGASNHYNYNGVMKNRVTNCTSSGVVGSSFAQVAGGPFVWANNTWSSNTSGTHSYGGGCLIDSGAVGVFANNVISTYDTSDTGDSGMAVFGGSYPSTSRITIKDNIFCDILSAWGDSGITDGYGGGIYITDYAGTMVIEGNTFVNCGRSTGIRTGASAITIANTTNATGAVITIDGNTLNNTSGLNLTTCVRVNNSVASGGGSMTINIGKQFINSFVTDSIEIDGYGTMNISKQDLAQTVSGSGTFTIGAWADTVLVSATGSVTLKLPGPAQVGATKQIWIKDVNGSAATYNIIISGNGYTIDGLSTITLSTNYGFVEVVSTGTSWSII